MTHGTAYAYYQRGCRCSLCAPPPRQISRTTVAELLAENAQLKADLEVAQRTVDRAIAEVVRHWTEKHAWKAEALAARRKEAAA